MRKRTRNGVATAVEIVQYIREKYPGRLLSGIVITNADRLEYRIATESYGQWWYDGEAGKVAAALGLTEDELAGVVHELVSQGRAYFEHNDYFYALALVDEQRQSFPRRKYTAGQRVAFVALLGGYAVHNMRTRKWGFVFPQVGIVIGMHSEDLHPRRWRADGWRK